MDIYLYDDLRIHTQLLPLTYLRPVCDIRVGILTIREKWSRALSSEVKPLVSGHLDVKYPSEIPGEALLINGALCPDDSLLRKAESLKPGQCLKKGDDLLACRIDGAKGSSIGELLDEDWDSIDYPQEIVLLDRPWHIFQQNAAQIQRDFSLITSGRKSAPITDHYSKVYEKEQIFLEEGVDMKDTVIDGGNGPVYIGKNTTLNMGTRIRGSFALLEGSTLSMGTKIRGDTTVGPGCKVGGEIGNSVFFGNSNKAHEGYLGNSVIAEWCNIGADTNTSNMKNDYSEVRLWDYASERFAKTGTLFCGLIMGDHSKSGINVMFNTGTSVGVACNIFNADYPRNFIPSFSKGDKKGLSTFPLNQALKVAERVVQRRNVTLTETDRALLEKVFEISARYRKD